MKFFTFFGKLRRKFLKLLFGRQLIANIEKINELFPLLNQVTEKVSAVSSEVASVSSQLADHVSSQIAEQDASLSCQLKEKEFNFELLLKTTELQRIQYETFAKYKNCFAGKNVTLIATGPTMADFETIPDTVYVGVNAAILSEKVTLDYFFAQDYRSCKGYIKETADYRNKTLKRFYGSLNLPVNYSNVDYIIPDSIINEHKAGKYYQIDMWYGRHVLYGRNFALDLSSEIICDYNSIAFPAMQFILYGNPKKIYLVGCDTSNLGTHAIGQNVDIDAETSSFVLNNLKFGWTELKKFASIYYPDTEIISVNPVGLKGLFNRDVYTKSYLEKHPEIQGDVL